MSSASVCIGLGSNLGDSLRILQDAWRQLGQHGKIRLQDLSAPYRTVPKDMESDKLFINAAGLLTSELSPPALLEVLHEVEYRFGRRRDPDAEGYQDRTLDLDLLLYDELILNTSCLTIPHPLMHTRLFVMQPLVDLVPERIHPVLNRSTAMLYRNLCRQEKTDEIEKVSWG